MTASMQDDDEIMLQAYCDGELDAAVMAEFERRLSVDSGQRSRCEGLLALRRALRSLPRENIPSGLEERVRAKIRAPRLASRWTWRALAACLLAGVIAGSLLISAFHRYQTGEDLADFVVASHIRSLLAPQPFDIASSDRHVLKPWFTTRLPVSPQVVDLSDSGFKLIGGRVDVVGHQPVATIVYKHAAHIVSLTILVGNQSTPNVTIAGYHVLSWHAAGSTYIAVSDVSFADLSDFKRAFIAETKQL